MKTTDKIVPDQHEGAQKDTEHSVVAANVNDAHELFLMGRHRLLDVNHWNEYSGWPSSSFKLIDGDGNEVSRTAVEGDYFKIDIPAPGPSSGDGFDWVFIEAIEDHRDIEGPHEHITMRVRPAKNPQRRGENISHFFSDKATSSFGISRHYNTVTAAVYGRNEIPNTSTPDLTEKIRNTIIATSAILGLSNIQWNSLVKGLIA